MSRPYACTPREPCRCGAEDCRECYPGNFDRHGHFIDPDREDEEDGGGDDFDPPEVDVWDDPRADFIAGNGPNDY